MHGDGRAAAATARVGAALLEVVVGLTILAVAGSAFVALLAQSASTVRAFRRREAQTMRAEAALERLTIVPRAELAARVGTNALPGLRVQIWEIAPSRYDIAIVDSATTVTLLRTSLYTPDSSRATPP